MDNLIIRKRYGERVRLKVEVAKTSSAIRKGLMNRAYLAPDSGMLFVFGRESLDTFWMKNTYIPLSIAFFDRYGTIINIEDMTPHSLAPVRADRYYVGAIEANKGFFERNGIFPGDVVEYKKMAKTNPFTEEAEQERIDNWFNLNGGEDTVLGPGPFTDLENRQYIEEVDGQYICNKCGVSTDRELNEQGVRLCQFCDAAEIANAKAVEEYKDWWKQDAGT